MQRKESLETRQAKGCGATPECPPGQRTFATGGGKKADVRKPQKKNAAKHIQSEKKDTKPKTAPKRPEQSKIDAREESGDARRNKGATGPGVRGRQPQKQRQKVNAPWIFSKELK